MDPASRHKDVIPYLVFGLMTTLVNVVVYDLLARVLDAGYLSANVVAWVASVLFAFVTNKFLVFRSMTARISAVALEMTAFFSARALSGLLDMGLMYALVGLAGLDDLVVKVFVNGVVIVLNYLFSKHVVFRDRPDAAGRGA